MTVQQGDPSCQALSVGNEVPLAGCTSSIQASMTKALATGDMCIWWGAELD